jgi:hypothetical protein
LTEFPSTRRKQVFDAGVTCWRVVLVTSPSTRRQQVFDAGVTCWRVVLVTSLAGASCLFAAILLLFSRERVMI